MDHTQEAFWTRAIEGSEEFVFVLDRDRRVRAVSGALARAFGSEPADLVGRRCAELMHPDGAVPGVCPLAELLIDGKAHDADVHSALLERDFFVTVTPLPGDDGEVVGAIHTAFDMTERRRVEGRLRDSEASLRSLMENISEVISRFDLSLRHRYVSPAIESWLGVKPAGLQGKRMHEAGFPAEVAELLEDALQRALAGRRAVDVEFSLPRPSGGGRAFLEARAYPEFDAAGEPVSVVSVIRDVTEHKAAAKALERSVRLLQHGERLAHLGSWEWDVASDTSVVSTEWQRIHGLVGNRLTNAEIATTCHEDDRHIVKEAFANAAAGRSYRADHRIVNPRTAEVRHLMTYGVPVLDAGDRLETVFGASLDVTEQVKAEEHLREHERRLQCALGDTVAALGATVALRDPYTAGHEVRVAELACLIAQRLGWDEAAVASLRTAALVHDVGKISIPAEILSKPTRLTALEFELIKGHPQAAYDILAPIAFDDHVAEVALQHHERLDGSGYPAGLRDGEILPAARVLAVADVVEAMVSHRPYRPALPAAEAIAEIRGGAGTRYDALVARACLRLLEEEGFAFSAS